MRGLEGKRALVTGAGRHRGIGRAIALRLAEEGAAVAVAGYRRDPATFPDHEREIGWQGAASVAAEIEASGGRAIAVEGDVSDPDDVAAMVDRVGAALGGIDVLVNNAALPSEAGVAPILDMDEALWFRTVDVNLNGLYLVTRDVGRLMREQRSGGAIINISSLAGMQGGIGAFAYHTSKWAVRGMTKSAASQLGKHGIRVNSVHPGAIETDMLFDLGDETVDRLVSAVPMGRSARPEEVGNVVLFLLSDESSYVSGAEIVVDGALIAG